jgi:hypothetical protein
MVIIYGRRCFGRVEARAGEHAHTSFVHVWYMPLVPLGSKWVTADLGKSSRGFDILLSPRSVVAAYLRMWGPIAAIGCFAAGRLGAMIAGAVIAALSLASWTWRNARARDARRSDFNLLAFGSRCEPARMSSTMRAALRHELEQRHASLDEVRPPEDVARYGARSREEAVVAYGLLRLASLEHHDRGAAGAASACDRLIQGDYEKTAAGEGPYREDHHAPAAIIAEVEHLASGVVGERAAPRPAGLPWHAFTWKRGLAALWFTAMCTAGAIGTSAALAAPKAITAAHLEGADARRGFVAVTCDRIQQLGSFPNGDTAYGCVLGQRFLPVRSADVVEASPVVGKLSVMDPVWPSEVREDPAAFQVFLAARPPTADRVAAIVLFVLDAALLALIGSWLVRRVRRGQRTRGLRRTE